MPILHRIAPATFRWGPTHHLLSAFSLFEIGKRIWRITEVDVISPNTVWVQVVIGVRVRAVVYSSSSLSLIIFLYSCVCVYVINYRFPRARQALSVIPFIQAQSRCSLSIIPFVRSKLILCLVMSERWARIGVDVFVRTAFRCASLRTFILLFVCPIGFGLLVVFHARLVFLQELYLWDFL